MNKNYFLIIIVSFLIFFISCDEIKKNKDVDIDINLESPDINLQSPNINYDDLKLNIKYKANIFFYSIERKKFKLTLFLDDIKNSGYNINEDNIVAYIKNGKESIKGKVEVIPYNISGKACAYSIVLDYSESMFVEYFDKKKQKKRLIIETLEEAIDDFINHLDGKNDIAEIIKFGTEIEVARNFTNDKKVLREAFSKEPVDMGATALYDATYQGITDLSRLSDKKYSKSIILFSDGGDCASNIGINDVLNYANKNKIPIFPIGLKYAEFLDEDLRKLAKESGGFYFNTTKPSELSKFYKRINNVLKNQYLLIVEWDVDDLPPAGTDVLFNVAIVENEKLITKYIKKIVLP